MSLRQILEQDRPLRSRSFVIVSPAILFFLWMLSLSLKYEIDNAAYPPIFIPERFAWKNYADVLASNRFLTYFVNSLIVTGTRDRCSRCWSACPPATASRACAAHKSAVVILIARITPGPVLSHPAVPAVPVARAARHAGPQIIIHLVVTVPIVIWIMIGYFETTPLELEEAAADRRRHALAGVPPCGAADRAARASRSPSSSR